MIDNEHITRVEDALRHARATLEPHSDTPGLDAEVLLAHVAGWDRARIMINHARPLEESIARHFADLIRRRAAGEAVAYLTGEREFWSLPFAVSPAVLIPRADTELLVERALAQFPVDAEFEVLDLGTGSGNIAVAIASERPACRVTAVDIDTDALWVARQNVHRHVAHNVELMASDWFASLGGRRFHMIVSNPPYVCEHDPHLLQGDVAGEPVEALVSGPDGLDDIATITGAARDHLLAPGWLLLEHGATQGAAVRDLLHTAGFHGVATRRDLAGHERVTSGHLFEQPGEDMA